MGLRLSRVWRAASCLLCAILTWKYGFPLEGTEFAGGTITGPVLDMSEIGVFLFVVAQPVPLVSRRISGAVTVLASVLCLPLYLYFTVPAPFRWIFRGEYTISLHAGVVWDKWSIVGILTLVIAASIGVRDFLWPMQEKPKDS
jgi:hypothetical protein